MTEEDGVFDEINGLPMHVLVIHGAVVLVPLAALMGLLFAIPMTRGWARWPLVLLAVVAVGTVFVARESGKAFEQVLEEESGENWAGSPVANLLETHEDRANLLFILTIAYAVVAIVAFVLSRTAGASTPVLGAVIVLLVLGSVALSFQTFRVGDVGSQAVWNPDGGRDFST